MDKKLQKLILDYQASVRAAVEIIQRSNIPLPMTCGEWVDTDVPARGHLKGGIAYFKHGYGCKVDLPTGPVDFDFGRVGEIDGFDLWRLINFANSNLRSYGFESIDAVERSFEAAVDKGSIVSSEYILYYLSESERTLAVELSKDYPGDLLPHGDQDKVIILYAHTFLAADLMRENYSRLVFKFEAKGRLSQKETVSLRIYFSSWLGYLRATCEGFRDLNMRMLLQKNRPQSFLELVPKTDKIGRLINLHDHSLRRFRNNVFHAREDIKPLMQFAFDDGGRLNWARELHRLFDDFFSSYRVLCEVHYLLNDRNDESQIRKGKARVKENH